MSANESTPAVSLREARQREDHAKELMYYYPTPANRERHAAARRATDEALVRAVVFWLEAVPESEWKDINDWSAVLDAVEKGTDE